MDGISSRHIRTMAENVTFGNVAAAVFGFFEGVSKRADARTPSRAPRISGPSQTLLDYKRFSYMSDAQRDSAAEFLTKRVPDIYRLKQEDPAAFEAVLKQWQRGELKPTPPGRGFLANLVAGRLGIAE